MSQSKNRPPIQLGGMERGGITTDGDAIMFTLSARDGRSFTFSAPYEAIPTIVDNFVGLAEAAAARRPKSDPQPGDIAMIRAVSVSGARVSRTTDGSAVCLELNTKGALQRTVQFDRQGAQELCEALQNELRQMTN